MVFIRVLRFPGGENVEHGGTIPRGTTSHGLCVRRDRDFSTYDPRCEKFIAN